MMAASINENTQMSPTELPMRPVEAGNSSTSSSTSRRLEVQALLAEYDAKTNQMGEYPAKDIINALTMSAERNTGYAPEIVSFLETKIHRVPASYKLPIFYLTDSILKNVGGSYLALLARNIVPLYSNCVRQVSGKDLRRFVHVLNTWETSRLFASEALSAMRIAADRALAVADPSAATQPISFAHEPPPPAVQRRMATTTTASNTQAIKQQQQAADMELRLLLTQMQNDMEIHPTKHLTLEQVRIQNPEWYNQLVAFNATTSNISTPSLQTEAIGSSSHIAVASSRTGLVPTPPSRLRITRYTAPTEPPKSSSNAAHLMELLKRKKRSPSRSPSRTPSYRPPSQTIITNDEPGRPPNASAVMSILKKLKGMNGQATTSSKNDVQAASMWFSDKIVDHKERVESNVQKLYAALPLVCRESGLRFQQQEAMDIHLDFLFRYNRTQKERGKNGGNSRTWYLGEDEWITSTCMEPKGATTSSFFEQMNQETNDLQATYDAAKVPVDETITRCRICGENFVKEWDEEEEEWMYINAVIGMIHHPHDSPQETIFHKYCYDAVMVNTKQITAEHLIPGTPQSEPNRLQSYDIVKTEPMEETEIKKEEEDDDDDDDRRIIIKSE